MCIQFQDKLTGKDYLKSLYGRLKRDRMGWKVYVRLGREVQKIVTELKLKLKLKL